MRAWRETFATLSLVVFTALLLAYTLIYLLDLVGPITDWQFVTPIAGWTWDLAHVLTVVQTRL